MKYRLVYTDEELHKYEQNGTCRECALYNKDSNGCNSVIRRRLENTIGDCTPNRSSDRLMHYVSYIDKLNDNTKVI